MPETPEQKAEDTRSPLQKLVDEQMMRCTCWSNAYFNQDPNTTGLGPRTMLIEAHSQSLWVWAMQAALVDTLKEMGIELNPDTLIENGVKYVKQKLGEIELQFNITIAPDGVVRNDGHGEKEGAPN